MSTIYKNNKSVNVSVEGRKLYVRWYIDGEEIMKPEFPTEVAVQIHDYLLGLYGKALTNDLAYETTCRLGEWLPYLEECDADFKNIKVVVHTGGMR